jgi:hypothetical protein
MPPSSARFIVALLFALTLWSRALCSAQDSGPQPAPQARVPPSSLAGARAAVAGGAIMFTAAPIVGLGATAAVQLAGPNNWLGCEDFHGHTDAECEEEERQHAREVERALPPIIVGSTLLGLGGFALGIWGITRMVRIRREQRGLRLDSAGLELDGVRPARLALRFRF